MAKIWPVYEGRQPTLGEPWADIPPGVANRPTGSLAQPATGSGSVPSPRIAR